MTEKNEKRLTLRGQLREAAAADLPRIKAVARAAVEHVADEYGADMDSLLKAIAPGSHKTADHNLVTQLTNKAESDLIEMWTNQQDLGEKHGDK